MDAPSFYIPKVSVSTPWSKAKKRWISAAEKLSTELGLQYLFCPEIDSMSEQVRAVRVKISREQTKWFAGSLYYRGADKPPIAVTSGQSQAVSRVDLLKRENWTIAGPLPSQPLKK